MSAKILIDPGHGGRDSGAVGPSRLKESDVNLEVALRLGKLLGLNKFAVSYTRTTDVFPSLTARWQQANRESVDYVVSIHCNSDGPTAHGVETLHHPNSVTGRRLADHIQKQLVARTGDRDRGLKPRTNLALLNGPRMPAVLPEIGFISHAQTEARLRSGGAYLDTIADALGRGIAGFLSLSWQTESPPASIPPPPVPAPVPPPVEDEDPLELPERVFACPHCDQSISLSFGPTGEMDVEKST